MVPRRQRRTRESFPHSHPDLSRARLNLRFSVGYAVTEPVRRAIRSLPEALRHPALDQNGTLRDGGEVAELTGMVDLAGYPVGTRITVRRERPHPGAQLSLFDHDKGLGHQVFLTDIPYSGGGSAQFLEVRHRGHATVEDHIRCGKNTGFGRFPSRHFDVNTIRLELSRTAIDLIVLPASSCWMATSPPPNLAGTPPCPGNIIASATQQLKINAAASAQP
ncbi:hypothetical protein GCM10023083_88550 [Streptomyces phyllanthi]